MDYCLAIDIGASSARHILGHKSRGEWVLEEVHRFKTPLVMEEGGHCHWDVRLLFEEILIGMGKCTHLGKIPSRVGIDCFGVDYALLDEEDALIGEVISYRDPRTVAAKREFLSPERFFDISGVYPHNFDTAYQLYADKQAGKLAGAKTLMMLPSYLCFLLTGVKQNELSALSTSGLLDARSGELSATMLAALGIEASLFPETVSAGTKIGGLLPFIVQRVGYDASVYACLEHDTASAFLGSGAKPGELLLSSGTWSLLGSFLDKPILSPEAFDKGFTNELSYPGQVRFLRNIMGMWIINRLKEELAIPSFASLTGLAKDGSNYPGVFDATDDRLNNPASMKQCVLGLIAEKGCMPPRSDGELLYAVYRSLAKAYAVAVKSLEDLTGKRYSSLVVFGGGVKAEILNELTEKELAIPLRRGPAEATAIGNLLCIGK